MKLRDLLQYTEIISLGEQLNLEINNVTYDSRQVEPGSLFVAISGYKTDGHYFIEEALSKGAKAIVIQDNRYQSEEYPWILVKNTRKALADLSCALYQFPSERLNIIGVTGTNGKTTTTNLITYVLEDARRYTGLIGTIHNRVGSLILPVHHTTPEASDMQVLLQEFVDKGAEYAVMEVSSHALDLYRVRGTEFDIAVFTNLTQDHLDFHENMEKYLAAKGKLFSQLGVNAHKNRRKFAILNSDDPYTEELKDMARVPVITYGIEKKADIKAEQVKVTAQGVSYNLTYTNQTVPVNLQLNGIFNVYNSLAAIAVGLVEGIPIDNIVLSLEKVPGILGRFQKVDQGQDFTVIVDYSHTPDSLENCLKTAKDFVQGRLITVFGCGGDRDRTKRPLMGEIAGRYSDYCIVTSDNPRSEDPQAIIKDIIPGLSRVKKPDDFMQILDRREAIFYAISQAKTHDCIIIAGKGHENYQILGPEVIPFDDKEVAQEALLSIKKSSQ